GIDNHDCCPDHDTVCEGKNATVPVTAPPKTCNCVDASTGQEYSLGESFKRDCNLCRCITLGHQTTLSCEEDLCVNNPDLI
ncbi:unnamed protein product, partial [Rotaria socialis]